MSLLRRPHSLGKLIEWKPQYLLVDQRILLSGPHSLGKLIEWKLENLSKYLTWLGVKSPLAGETN